MGKIRVLLADDHEAVLARVRVVLGEEFEIIGSVMNGNDAVTEVQRLDPDVLVIDISRPGLNRLQAASRLQRHRIERSYFGHASANWITTLISSGLRSRA